MSTEYEDTYVGMADEAHNKIAQLTTRIADLTEHARRMTSEAAEAEDTRKRADRDADLAGQRADHLQAIADRLARENRELRARVAVANRALQVVSVTRAFTVTAPCRALVPVRVYERAATIAEILIVAGMNDAARLDDLRTAAAAGATFGPLPF